MPDRGIVFVDANAIWHYRIAKALGAFTPTIAFLPHADLACRFGDTGRPNGETKFVSCGLPLSWASRLAEPAQALLARRVFAAAGNLPDPVVILTSPAYDVLARRLEGRLPIVYYCADDYGGYSSWRAARAREATIVQRSSLAIYVSQSLCDRAIREDELDASEAFVSPNATEARFADGSAEIPADIIDLPRPVLGILGALSDRLDLDLIRRTAELENMGSVLVAGPVDPNLRAELTWIHGPKIHVTGRLPHERMHHYARAMDAALIPYAATTLNWHCSPMRLWDHLATGIPIFALDTCDQINRMQGGRVMSAPAKDLLDLIPAQLANGSDRLPNTNAYPLFWGDRAAALYERVNSITASRVRQSRNFPEQVIESRE